MIMTDAGCDEDAGRTQEDFFNNELPLAVFNSVQPEAEGPLLDAGFLYCILWASSLDPKLHRGSRGAPRSGVAFPTTSGL